MAITDDWDETLPADPRNPALGDEDIRQFKRQVRERMRKGGHLWESVGPSTDTEAGKHMCGENALGDGLSNDGEFAMFESSGHAGNKTTKNFRLCDGAHATLADTLRIGDGAGGSQPYTLDIETVSCTALVVSTTVTAPAGQLHPVESSSASGSVALTSAGFTTIDSDTITTQPTAAGKVLVMWTGVILGTGSSNNVQLRFTRDGTPFYTVTECFIPISGGSGIMITMQFVDTGATAATTHTYAVQGQAGDTATVRAQPRSIVLIEFRGT